MKPRASTSKRGVFHSRKRNDLASPAVARDQARIGVQLVAFNKPYGVICQFTGDGPHQTLANFIHIPDIYPAGRLDTDSEGLLLLTNHGRLQNWISNPVHKLAKTYWAQVEGELDDRAIDRLCAPLDLGDFITVPGRVRRIPAPPDLWERVPPIRQRAAIPTSWLEITLSEGKNRQVRRMTAKVGFPTLRLIRASIGPIGLNQLHPGQSRAIGLTEIGYAK